MKLKRKVQEHTIQEAFEEFIKYCNVRNLSEHTIRYYNDSMKMFAKFYNLENSINTINSKLIDNFILFLKNNTNYNSTSINTTLRGIRAPINYWVEIGYLEQFKIKTIKADKKIKETYTDAELALLIKKPNLNKCTFGEYRNWVIINFLLATGCRANTLLNIKINNLDFDNFLIHLEKTKNKKQQIIPMAQTLSIILKEYLQYRHGEANDLLFADIWGNQLSLKGLQSTIRYYNHSRGVSKTSLHLFRHTFAKKWIISNGDIFRLQKILGHSSLDMVREYVNMFTADLQQDFNMHNALDISNKTKVR